MSRRVLPQDPNHLYSVTIDGVALAEVGPGDSVAIPVDAGPHEVSVKYAHAAVRASAAARADVTVAEGEELWLAATGSPRGATSRQPLARPIHLHPIRARSSMVDGAVNAAVGRTVGRWARRRRWSHDDVAFAICGFLAGFMGIDRTAAEVARHWALAAVAVVMIASGVAAACWASGRIWPVRSTRIWSGNRFQDNPRLLAAVFVATGALICDLPFDHGNTSTFPEPAWLQVVGGGYLIGYVVLPWLGRLPGRLRQVLYRRRVQPPF